jgi:hypothetical protein
MSARKTRIAKQIEELGLGKFTGIKANGVYTIGRFVFRSLNAIEEYIKVVKVCKAQQSEAKISRESLVAKLRSMDGDAILLPASNRSYANNEARWLAAGFVLQKLLDVPLVGHSSFCDKQGHIVEFTVWLGMLFTDLEQSFGDICVRDVLQYLEVREVGPTFVGQSLPKVVVDVELSHRRAILEIYKIEDLRWVVNDRKMGIKSRKRKVLIDAIIADVRRELEAA